MNTLDDLKLMLSKIIGSTRLVDAIASEAGMTSSQVSNAIIQINGRLTRGENAIKSILASNQKE